MTLSAHSDRQSFSSQRCGNSQRNLEDVIYCYIHRIIWWGSYSPQRNRYSSFIGWNACMNVWYSWGKCLNIRTFRLWGVWKGNNTLDVVVVENLLGELNHFQTNIGENLVHACSNFHSISTDTSLTKACFPNNDPPQGFTSFYNPKYTIFENSCCAKPSIVSALVLETASIKGSWCSPDR